MARRKSKSKSVIFVFIIAVFLTASYYEFYNPIPTDSDSINVYFCPEDDCALRVIDQINQAEESVDIAIYSFTLDELGDSLVSAHNRGVKVRVVFEKQQVSQYSEYWKLLDLVEVVNDTNSALMHNKFAVIDGKIVITGSFNWSKNADERNDENLLIIKSKEITEKYKKEFQEIFLESIN